MKSRREDRFRGVLIGNRAKEPPHCRCADGGELGGCRRKWSAMVLRPCHSDSRWPPVEEHPPCEALQLGDNLTDVVRGVGVDGRCQTRFEAVEGGRERDVVVSHQQRDRTEDLGAQQLRVGDDRRSVGGYRKGATPVAGNELYARGGEQVVDTTVEGCPDGRGEHRGRGDLDVETLEERGTKTTPGLVQNCPAPMLIDATRPAASSVPRCSSAAGKITTGLMLPSSPWKGMGSGLPTARSNSARPPAVEPVNATAVTAGC